MSETNSSNVSNIGIVGHGGSGKTSLLEALLFISGVTSRLGKVEDGSTVADYLPEEIKRKISVSAKVISFFKEKATLNVIDTPGYGDFIGEVISTLNVVDSVLYVVCGVSGVEVQTEIISDYVNKLNLPQAVFVNKLDRENADFFKILTELEGMLKKPVIPLVLPLGKETNLAGYIDLLTKETVIENNSKEFDRPDDNLVASYHLKLIETVIETDENLLTKYLDDNLVDPIEIKFALKKAIQSGDIVPVLAGSANNLVGITPLIKLLWDDMPLALTDLDDDLFAYVFKTMADPYVGKLSFIRVFSGILTTDSQILNKKQGKAEKVGQILKVQGKKQQPVEKLTSGDIGVIPKLALTLTGDILCKSDNEILVNKVFLEFPQPYFEFAVEPKSKGDEEKLSSSLSKIAEEDPTLRILKRAETNETIIKGMGEIHLETTLERLSKKFGVEVNIRKPKIPYRETIKSSIKIEGKHKKQTGGHGQYGHVWLEIEPLAGQEFLFSEKIFGGAVPKQYIPAVEKGIVEAMQEGVLAGYPVTNVKATLYDGSYHNVDSSELAFKIAASQAFKKGCLKASPILLEPIYDLMVLVPEQFMGDIISDLNTRRGKVLGMDPGDKWQTIKAQVPLEELQSYSIDLKSLTQGRASYRLSFSHYAEVPQKISEAIVLQEKETSSLKNK